MSRPIAAAWLRDGTGAGPGARGRLGGRLAPCLALRGDSGPLARVVSGPFGWIARDLGRIDLVLGRHPPPLRGPIPSRARTPPESGWCPGPRATPVARVRLACRSKLSAPPTPPFFDRSPCRVRVGRGAAPPIRAASKRPPPPARRPARLVTGRRGGPAFAGLFHGCPPNCGLAGVPANRSPKLLGAEAPRENGRCADPGGCQAQLTPRAPARGRPMCWPDAGRGFGDRRGVCAASTGSS